MTFSRQDIQSLQLPVRTGDKTITGVLDGTTTVQIVDLGDVFAKVSFQATGTLLGTIEFSLNGVNFANSTAIAAANAIASFSTHNVCSIRVTRTSGTGRLVMASE
jgi:hypothetical protein